MLIYEVLMHLNQVPSEICPLQTILLYYLQVKLVMGARH
jgi:hypothetical protein